MIAGAAFFILLLVAIVAVGVPAFAIGCLFIAAVLLAALAIFWRHTVGIAALGFVLWLLIR